ncbi:hypothetical protein C7K70_06635 [Aeromonas hydrophila]|nr:hypothetical protein C7K70_06635 [Aeromonas hydrophila]
MLHHIAISDLQHITKRNAFLVKFNIHQADTAFKKNSCSFIRIIFCTFLEIIQQSCYLTYGLIILPRLVIILKEDIKLFKIILYIFYFMSTQGFPIHCNIT